MKRYMYLGPDLHGIVSHNQIYTYHPEEVIAKACKVSPLAKHLFVDMDNIVTHKNELRNESSFLFLTYQKVMKEEQNGALRTRN